MGIPKFFRSMSERYPLISQLVEENKIPEFDNLYLDMNGIIHNCSHPDDNDAHFRITEADIFLAVFSYIEHIFTKIKPQKLMFLAVDGVAPRAKMNQQRSRRFRTAKEAKEVRDKAERRGEEMPEEAAFDSNCITPGTPFMARLSQQLKYFLAKKVTEDSNWRGVEVVLSGHEVPGEGEHKIMEYIRLAKAQPGYNPNMRHCLYGLDADLIMLGLLSHDPHFALLREEVQFGPRKKSRGGLETQNFFLLHLSLFREYLDLEFQELRSTLPFDYSLERIIDDFILLNIFVGNDFLPHLPGLHINEGALPMLFAIYKSVLPVAGGYINEDGTLRVDRLQLILAELTKFEAEQFENEYADSSWYKGKQEKPKSKKQKLTLSKEQQALFKQVRDFVLALRKDPVEAPQELFLPPMLPARDQRFLSGLTEALGLGVSFNEYDPVADAPATAITYEPEAGALPNSAEKIKAADRVLGRYENAAAESEESDEEDAEELRLRKLGEKMHVWKTDYYREKLHIDYQDKTAMRQLAFRYIEGLQWVLHYYYDGVASWGWFYDYHYAPKISDLLPVLDMKFDFDLGKPFRPFDQLMGVLPALSSSHIPEAFRDLMTDPASPIIDFYPADFEADLNGKKQDWEAVVKIPFIDEKRLLSALDKRQGLLTADERARNGFGAATRLTFDADREYFLPSSLPGVFPDIVHSRAKIEDFKLPALNGRELVKGLCEGVELGKRALAGFPSMQTIPHVGRIDFHGINVFQSESKAASVVLRMQNRFEGHKSEEVAAALVGQRTFTHYPYLAEGLCVAISDELFRYELVQGRVVSTPHKPDSNWRRKVQAITHHYSKRYGIVTGPVDVLLHVRPLKGLQRMDDGSFVKDYESSADKEVEQVLQLAVSEVVQEDARTVERRAEELSIEFPERSKVFFLGERPYGAPAAVVAATKKDLAIEIAFFPNQVKENTAIHNLVAERTLERYYPSFVVAKKVGMSSLALSKITSSMLLEHNGKRVNIGLALKFEARSCKVLGYSRKSANGWEFSDKTVALVNEYKASFPEIIDTLQNRSGDLREASQFFAPSEVDARMRALVAWVKEKGVRDFEAVPLYAEQLGRETVQLIEGFTARLAAARAQADAGGNATGGIKRAIIKGMPRTALLKPAHAPFRLQAQRFELGDRVIVVADSGNVPMSARGVVIGLNTSSVDVVFDLPFLSGSRLGDRCSPYRGATLAFDAILNLTQPQFVSGPSSAASNGDAAASPLDRTVGESNGAGGRGGASAGRGRGRGAGNGVGQPFRPPNMMRAAPTPPRAPGGVAILQRPSAAASAAPVRPDVAFAGVAGGKERPSARHAEQQRNVNPHLAALSKNGANVPRGPRADAGVPTQPRGAAAGGGRGGRGAAPAARGRGGRAPPAAATTQH